MIWLHGLGADGHDFAPIAAELRLPDALGTKFILPHAPQRPITINGGMIMRGWYDIAYTDIGRTPDLDGIATSLEAIEALIDAEKNRGIPPERILIAGFSQGAVLAIEAMTRGAQWIGGAIALSGYLARAGRIPKAEDSRALYLAHGSQDPIVPFTLGVQAREELIQQGYEVTWGEWPMGHTVCMEEINAIRDWVIRRLDD
jgi:phospholipase/carboxylesterase